jgi:hypothetical protein
VSADPEIFESGRARIHFTTQGTPYTLVTVAVRFDAKDFIGAPDQVVIANKVDEAVVALRGYLKRDMPAIVGQARFHYNARSIKP